MKTLSILVRSLPVLLTSLLLPHVARSAAVGPGGYTNDFSAQPPAADWSTFAITGAAADLTTAGGMDAAVQAVAASAITSAVGADTGNPPGANSLALWTSAGYLQTRPTGNGATLLMCSLINNLGANAASLTITYNFDKGAVLAEEIEGQRAYYSLTGAVNSWTNIPTLSSASPGVVTATVSNLWPAGSTLYLLWADDNGSQSPDTACLMDNFSVTAMSATQVPVTIINSPASQVVDELMPVTLVVGASGNPVPTIEWYRNDVAIANATNASYTIAATPLSDHNARFMVIAANVVSNQTYYATSQVATLTVNADLVRPALVAAFPAGQRQVVVAFSERVTTATATNAANYTITSGGGSLTVSNATLDTTQTNVVLNVSSMTAGTVYTLVVNGVTDQSAAASVILAGSSVQFTGSSFAATNIGNPAVAGSAADVSGGFNLTAGGTNIAGASDQFFFYSQAVAGAFDYAVRVESMSLSDAWAKAGLMARETLSTNSRFAMVLATPSFAGSFFLARTIVGGNPIPAGGLPINYPQTWLRLTRTGNDFSGYASIDGQNWVLLGMATLTNAPTSVYLGLAACGATTNGTAATSVAFRNLFTSGGGAIVSSVALPWEPLGPATRHSGMIISEIMYHPKYSNDLEFIELFNAGLIDQDLTGFRLAGDVDYAFPANTSVPVGGFLVVARKPALLQAAYGISGVLGPWVGGETNALPDSGGRIRLRNPANAVVLEVNYLGGAPWPLSADGAGHSLVLARPSFGQDNPRGWAASDHIGGSPGRMEAILPEPARDVVVNEFLANSDAPAEDFIELYNHSAQPADISGFYLSDDRDTNKFRIPANTMLPPRGFVVFTQTQLGFGLDSTGERIYLVNSNQTRVQEVVAFNGQAPGVSMGRCPDGGTAFRALAVPTPANPNSGALLRPIVINEIMFNPPSGDSDDEFVELYNRGTNAVDVSHWRFTDGIDFSFPAGTVIAGHGYLVVAKNWQRLFINYAQLNGANTVGNYEGTLANGGEQLTLSMPEYLTITNTHGGVTTNVNWIAVNEVAYTDAGRWAHWADGGGSSLELIDPFSDNRLIANWADSDESAKSEWTNVTFTGAIDNIYPRGSPGSDLNEIQVMLLGEGEALMDDLVAQASPAGANLVNNPNFTSGTNGWTIQGNHVRSTLEPVGPNNPSQSLHLRASAAGDNGANRVECDLASALSLGANATLGGRFRWLRGFPIVLLRLHGGGIEAVGTLPLPLNLGSPGLPNSRALANVGPAIYDVSHSPILPAANQPVVVTARISDPDGLGVAQTQYRLDPSATVNSATMRDDGTGGDAVAGDGIYSATISGQPAGTMVAFRVSATDTSLSPASTLFPVDAPVHECLIRFGEPTLFGNLGVYRLWTTAANYNTWKNRERLSNEPVDGTFVYGNLRVIYNAGARYRGSPFTRSASDPVGVAVNANYVWSLPADDLFLNSDELNLDSLEPVNGGYQRDATALRETTSFKMAEQLGLDFSYQRYVHIVINGVTSPSRNIPVYSDSQQPNGEYADMWYPDSVGGELYKIDDWFEFDDTPAMQANKCANLGNWITPPVTGAVKKQSRYRWNWEKKFNHGYTDDYSNLYAVDNALNAADATHVSAVNNAIDAEDWMTVLAFGHVIGDWDRYGYNRGKNQFVYKSAGERFRMLLWDLDFSLGCLGGHGPTQDLFTIAQEGESGQNNMPEIARLYGAPYFRRIYLQALLRIANGPLQDSAYAPTLDARYRTLQANNVNVTSPYVASGAQSISVPDWIKQRRTNIFTTIATQTNFAFAVTSSNNLSLASNIITLAGRAPLGIKTIMVNGFEYAVTWTSVTDWTMRVPLAGGTNLLVVQPYDRDGRLFANSVVNVTATYTNAMPDPVGLVVFNELMFDPLVPGTEYVELFNASSSVTFDLSGWKINGLDYTFPLGSTLGPRAYLMLVKDRHLCLATYSAAVPIFDQYSGNLQPDGETLTLYRPGNTPAEDVVIDRVRYEAAAPWGAATRGTGASLQLIDAGQDNGRVANWSDGAGWRYFSQSGTNSGSFNKRLMLWLDAAGALNIDDMFLALGPVAEAGSNYISNGNFEAPLTGYWKTNGANAANSTISAAIKHSGNSSMELIFTNTGGSGNYLYYDLTNSVITNFATSNYTVSFWYLPTPNASKLTARLGTGIAPTFSVRPSNSTPGTTNSVVQSVPAFPTLWLNEVQPVNLNGIVDGTATREPFIEIYNSGNHVVSLDGFYLSDNYTNLGQWAFPAGAAIPPGEFRTVFADGQPGQTTPAEWHANFRLDAASTQVALSRTTSGIELLDYLNFAGLRTNWSYGDFPDGQMFYRRALYYVTPGGTNDGREAPITVSINEWMAANASTITDPADNDFDDWFELSNTGTNVANLEGYYLTDNLTNKTKFKIPAGYGIPPGGRLLVWADNETGQNNSNRADLHVNFQLSRDGEAIGLFDANGVAIDTVTFGAQTDDVSEGRCPDGGATIAAQATPTPRAANGCGGGNNAPVLSPIGSRTVHQGQMVSFTASAIDAEAPPQSLSFSLIGAPPGASIQPASGAFTWNTTAIAAPSTNSFTVRVSDSANPPLNDSETIGVTVLPPPGFGWVARNGTQLNWSWNTIPGVHYQLLFKQSLGDPNWTPVGGVQTGTGTPLSVTIDTSDGPSGFYQITVAD